MRRLGRILPALLLAAVMAVSLLPRGFGMTEQEIQDRVNEGTGREITGTGQTDIEILETIEKPTIPGNWCKLIIRVQDKHTKRGISGAMVRLEQERAGSNKNEWDLYADRGPEKNNYYITGENGEITIWVLPQHVGNGEHLQHFRVVIEDVPGYVNYTSIPFHVEKDGHKETVGLEPKEIVNPDPTPTPFWPPWWPWPTPTPTPTPTPRPTPTPKPTPTPTPTPKPTPTPSPSPAPSASPEPSASPAPSADPSPAPTGGRRPNDPNTGGGYRPGPGGNTPAPTQDPGAGETGNPDPVPTETAEVLETDPPIQVPVDPGGKVDEPRPLPPDSHACELHWPIIPCIIVTLIGGIIRLLILWRKEREYQRRKAEELERMGSV